jgi:uncharacterized membrane protein
MPMQATTTAPLFSAALRPDRSLGMVGGWVAMVASGLVAIPLMVTIPEAVLPVVIAFVVVGAGLVVASLRLQRRGRLMEQVTLWADQLEIGFVDRTGARTLRRFDPAKVRLALHRDENEKVVSLRLRAGKETIELGAFLNPDDKGSFAKAFGTALRKARAAG